MRIEERGCFCGDLEGGKSLFLDEVERPRLKDCCSVERIGGIGYPISLLSSFMRETVLFLELTSHSTNYVFGQGVLPFLVEWGSEEGPLGHG
jgi:hypothetical protein